MHKISSSQSLPDDWTFYRKSVARAQRLALNDHNCYLETSHLISSSQGGSSCLSRSSSMSDLPTSPSIPSSEIALQQSHQQPASSSAASPSSLAISRFRAYLSNLLPAVLGAEEEDILDSLLHESQAEDFEERVAKFVGDSAIGVVYVNQVRERTVEGDGE
jgi:hypothetical protein